MRHRLLLLRHAKSSWDDPSLTDRDRPLSKRGRAAARRMGEHLRASGGRIDLVLCSSALRTRETLERLALGVADVRVEDRLYGAGPDELLDRLRDVAGDPGAVLVIGHDPGMHELAAALAGPDLGEPRRACAGSRRGHSPVFSTAGRWT
jgi:phosphohistidine phosphatase